MTVQAAMLSRLAVATVLAALTIIQAGCVTPPLVVKQLKRTIEADPGALRAVSQYVKWMERQPDARVDEYCQTLAMQGRAAQAMECAETARTKSRDTWLAVLATLPSLSVGGIQELITKRPELGQVLAGVVACQDPSRRATVNGQGLDPRTVRIYLRLADSLGEPSGHPRAVCFLSHAAVACLQALAQTADCSEPAVPTLYAQALIDAGHKNELEEFEEAIFEQKAGLYRKLESNGRVRSQDGVLALLKLHALFANMYLAADEGRMPWQTVEYHKQRINEIWRSTYPNQPLASSLLIGEGDDCGSSCAPNLVQALSRFHTTDYEGDPRTYISVTIQCGDSVIAEGGGLLRPFLDNIDKRSPTLQVIQQRRKDQISGSCVARMHAWLGESDISRWAPTEWHFFWTVELLFSNGSRHTRKIECEVGHGRPDCTMWL